MHLYKQIHLFIYLLKGPYIHLCKLHASNLRYPCSDKSFGCFPVEDFLLFHPNIRSQLHTPLAALPSPFPFLILHQLHIPVHFCGTVPWPFQPLNSSQGASQVIFLSKHP